MTRRSRLLPTIAVVRAAVLVLAACGGRQQPAAAPGTADASSCQAGTGQLTIATGNDHVRTAMQYAIAQATGGEVPESTQHQHALFENSVSGDPSPVQCEPDLPGDIYLSAEMPAEDQAALLE